MITKNLLLSCLFIAGVTTQMTMAEDNIVSGTTVGFKHCMKPGAPINITYQSKRVALNEVSDVNITLTTTITSGEMEVEFNLDKNLYTVGDFEKNMKFTLSPDVKEHKINLQVFADKDGLYYVRLSGKIDSESGIRIRAMAVPIYVGDGELKSRRHNLIMKAVGGENLSISKAEETIEVIKD